MFGKPKVRLLEDGKIPLDIAARVVNALRSGGKANQIIPFMREISALVVVNEDFDRLLSTCRKYVDDASIDIKNGLEDDVNVN